MDERRSWIGPFFIIAGLLGYASRIYFFGFPMTGFEWPSILLGPFFERQLDPLFLKDDYLVDTMLVANPNSIFIFFVQFFQGFGLHWHSAILLIKSLIVFFIPAFTFLFWVEATRSLLLKERLSTATHVFALMCIGFLLFTPGFQFHIMVGHLLQTELKATPVGLATLWGLIGSVQLFRWSWVSYLMLMLATLTQPSVGFCFFLINLIFQRRHWHILGLSLLFLSSIVIPFAILASFFSPSETIAIQKIVETYVYNYLPSQLHVASWRIVDLAVPMTYYLGFFGLIIYLYFDREKAIARSAALTFCIFCLSIWSQYFFVDVFPSRWIIGLEPIRIMGFTFLMGTPFLLVWLEQHWALRTLSIDPPAPRAMTLYFMSFLCAFAIFLISENRPQDRLIAKAPKLYNWVFHNTEKDQVFIAPLDSLSEEFVLVTKRPMYVSGFFPLLEEMYPEYLRRLQLIFGSNPRDQRRFFDNQTLEGWGQILDQEKIDFIVFANDSESQLALVEPTFKGENWTVVSKEAILKLLKSQ